MMDEQTGVPEPGSLEEELDRYRAALRRIADCPERRFPSPGLMAKYLQNIALGALGEFRGGVEAPRSVTKRLRIRDTQLILKKGPNSTLSAVEIQLRIGDLVAMMLCAEYMKRHEGCHIAFQLIDGMHKSLKADVLFQNTLDEILTEEGPECGLLDREAPEIYDPGPLWVASTFYHERYGAEVVPRLNLDPAHYEGPEMDWGHYVLFSPLFDPPYNCARGMEEGFVNQFCDQLHGALGERLLVVTDRPEKIHSQARVLVTDKLYDLAYLIGKAKVYIGGDTGFTHLAAAARVEHLFAVYGSNYYQSFAKTSAELSFDDWVNPFAAWGKYWGAGQDLRPKCDLSETTLHFHVLENNRLPTSAMEAMVQEIRSLL